MSGDAERLTAVISPLRRALLAAATARESLPDIPDAQIEVLRVLLRDRTHSPSSIAAELGLGRSTVSNLLASMERGGLVRRTQRSHDRRRVGVSASPSAAGLFARYDRAAAAIVDAAIAGLPQADRAALQTAVPALERLRDALVSASREERAAGPAAEGIA